MCNRIDGKTEGSERQRLVDAFNNPQNERVKCTLISTRAGALGINLFAANRVIIVDGSWNPTHDLQAIYRAWRCVLDIFVFDWCLSQINLCVIHLILKLPCRYGQKKPVYAYRLVAHGTLEEKIYKRQVLPQNSSFQRFLASLAHFSLLKSASFAGEKGGPGRKSGR